MSNNILGTSAKRSLRSHRFVPPWWLLAGAILLSSMQASAAAVAAPTPAGPRLARLQVELWPEFDRTAMTLVILRGELAADVKLPAAVNLRIPATSGGPTAVAYSAGPGTKALNLAYDRQDASGGIALRFAVPERFFQVEFYDPVATSGQGRTYSYAWSADLAADRLGVVVQEPAGASALSVEPVLGSAAPGQDGLTYRSAELGPSPAGKPVSVKLDYTKNDPRTSAEILGANVTPPPPPPAGPTRKDLLLWLTGIVAVTVLGAVLAVTWWSRRQRRAHAAQGLAPSCRRCGATPTPEDRFCARCGAPLA